MEGLEHAMDLELVHDENVYEVEDVVELEEV